MDGSVITDHTRLGDQVEALLARHSASGMRAPLRVLWDFDGVIADTEPLHDETYRELARRRSHHLEPGYFDELVGRTEQSIWARLIELGFPAEVDDIDALMQERQEAYLQLALETLQPTWVATSMVERFAARGAEQLIVSNGDPESIARLLRKWRLDDSLTIAPRTPSEDKMEILRRLCVPPVIVIEDNARFLEAARQAGAMTVAVQNSFNVSQRLEADIVASIVPGREEAIV